MTLLQSLCYGRLNMLLSTESICGSSKQHLVVTSACCMVFRRVGPKEEVSIDLYEDHDCLETVHTTQVALGSDPAPGRHTVFITSMSGKYAIGTLERGRCEQFPIDLMAASDMKFSHSGDSDVYVSGYKTLTMLGSDDEGHYMYDESEEEEEQEDDEKAPAAVPLNGKKPKVGTLVSHCHVHMH